MKEITIVNLTKSGEFDSLSIPEKLKNKKFKTYSSVAKAIEVGQKAVVKVMDNQFLDGFGEVEPLADGSYMYPGRLHPDW